MLEFIIEHYPKLFDDSGDLVTEDKASKMNSALSAWMGGDEEAVEEEEDTKKGSKKKGMFGRKKENHSPSPRTKRSG